MGGGQAKAAASGAANFIIDSKSYTGSLAIGAPRHIYAAVQK
jgi:hypothetical protein